MWCVGSVDGERVICEFNDRICILVLDYVP